MRIAKLAPDATVTRFVTSADGTRIGYLRQGHGPGVVLVQGAMADVHAYRDLAAGLATAFTVCSVERRGRGLSPRPYGADHDIARDVEDVDAVLAATGARAVFGLSSGAVIALECARTLDRVHRVAVYEPPFYPEGIGHDGIRRLHAAIDRGDLADALVESLLTAGTAPAVIQKAPRRLARMVARIVLEVDSRTTHGRSTFRELLPGVRYDFHDVAEMGGTVSRFADLRKPVLLLSGSRSPAFLRAAVDTLVQVLPDANHVELPGLGHDGPWNNGRPLLVADALRPFLADPV